jgi:hypothetical protein
MLTGSVVNFLTSNLFPYKKANSASQAGSFAYILLLGCVLRGV